MSIFDKLKKTAGDALNKGVKNAASALVSQKETFTFRALPESLAELQALPESAMDTPFKTAALTVCALCVYAADKSIGAEMLNFLLGPRPLNNVQISFLNDRFRDGHHVPFSYFKGAVSDNDYTPDEPFTVTVESGAYSDANAGEGYKKLFIRSGGADNPREIVLRQRGSDGKWFLWEQFLLVGIRDPKIGKSVGMKKRLLITVMAFAALFGLFGCGGGAQKTVTSVESMTLTLRGMRGSSVYTFEGEAGQTELRHYREIYSGEETVSLNKVQSVILR